MILRLLLILLFFSFPIAGDEVNRILYLMQRGHYGDAIELYQNHKKTLGHDDISTVEKMGLTILDQGYRSKDPEIQMITLYGAGIATNDRAQYILEEGVKSDHPQFQLVALNFLSRMNTDEANDMINRAMSSNYVPIRLEAAFHLAAKKHPKATGQIESLMQKLPPEALPIFPQLLALSGDREAIRTLRRLMSHPLELTRIETVHSATKNRRDDLLPDIRRLASQHYAGQQEACAAAFGKLKDEQSIDRLQELSRSTTVSVQLAALSSLYDLGYEEARDQIIKIANAENPFAITLLADISGTEDTLNTLINKGQLHTRVNATISLLEHRDRRCLKPLCDILLSDSRDLAYTQVSSYGKGLTAWKVVPSAMQNFKDTPILIELSRSFREKSLQKALDLPEEDFIKLAHTLFENQQLDLVPLLTRLLENMQTPDAIGLLKHHREKIGSPLIRNYCNLALFRLREPGPYKQTLKDWITSKQSHDLIEFRPIVPWDERAGGVASYQLTPQDTSRLLVEAYESLVQVQDEETIATLLKAIQNGNPKNRYALAGLLIRSTN